MYVNKTIRYIDNLDKIVQAYNESFHNSIERSPASIKSKNLRHKL